MFLYGWDNFACPGQCMFQNPIPKNPNPLESESLIINIMVVTARKNRPYQDVINYAHKVARLAPPSELNTGLIDLSHV